MRPNPEEPVAEHQQEGAFFCIAGISRTPAAQPGFQIVDDAAATVDMPLRRDGGQKDYVEKQSRRRWNAPTEENIRADQ